VAACIRLSLSSPVLSNENRLSLQVNWLLLFRVSLLTLFLGISSILQFTHPGLNLPSPLAIGFFITFIYLFSIASAVIANRLSHFVTFAYGQIITDSALATLLVYYSGGSESIFTFFYFFPIISAGLMLFRRGGLLIAGVTIINYGMMLSSEYVLLATQLPASIRANAITAPAVLLQNFLIYSLSFILVAMLSAFLAERLEWTEAALSQTSRHLDLLSQLYKQIFDDITSGIITVDTEGTITSFNRAAEKITGYSASEVMDHKLGHIFPGLQSASAEDDRPTLDLTRKDQRTIPVAYSWSRLNLPERCDDCRVYTLQDLSRIRQMEAQIRQSEKMAAIGKIAAGIAHEFRNPLAAISGAAQVLDQEFTPSSNSTGKGDVEPSANHSLLNIIIRECSRLEANITDFLQFSKPATPEQSWIGLAALIDECWTVIQRSAKFRDNCQLKTNIAYNLDCWADQHQLKQVFLNLIHNACLAMDHGGLIEISAREETPSDGQGTMVIEVRDTGCGIPSAMLPDIFAPFFTTRENGTGLGLAIVQQIIEGHQGAVTVQSTVGQGTTFTITLPLPQ
jgi:two-component system sensor histidine kinase PilS (NtrC family)